MQASAAQYGPPPYVTQNERTRRPDVTAPLTNQRRRTRPLSHSRQFRAGSARRPAAGGEQGRVRAECWKPSESSSLKMKIGTKRLNIKV